MAAQQIYRLKHAAVRVTRNTAGIESEEQLLHAGHEVPIRRPRGKDLRAIDRFDGQPMAMTLAMIVQLTPLDPDTADCLDAEDVLGLGELLAEFMPDVPQTGTSA